MLIDIRQSLIIFKIVIFEIKHALYTFPEFKKEAVEFNINL